jgi:hypothetical protein
MGRLPEQIFINDSSGNTVELHQWTNAGAVLRTG